MAGGGDDSRTGGSSRDPRPATPQEASTACVADDARRTAGAGSARRPAIQRSGASDAFCTHTGGNAPTTSRSNSFVNSARSSGFGRPFLFVRPASAER